MAPLRDPTRAALPEAYQLNLPAELTQSRWIAGQAADYIREQRRAGQPWFAGASFVPPQHPWAVPEPYASVYDPPRCRSPAQAELQAALYRWLMTTKESWPAKPIHWRSADVLVSLRDDAY